MSDQNNEIDETNETGEAPGVFSRRLVTWPLALLGLTLAFALVANTVSAWGRAGAHDIDDLKSHAEHFLDRALERLDATDEQSTAIREIVLSAVEDLHAEGDGFRSGRDDFRAVLMADSIDRSALEALRQNHLDRADAMSRTLTESLADVIELLTPEQRAQLHEHFERHGAGHGHGWRGRWGRH